MPPALRTPLAALALILAAALIHQLPAVQTPFFADDYIFLDQVARGSLAHVLTSPDPIGNYYRPLGRQLYFWVVARALGGSARAAHALNLALWLAVVALLFAVARRVAGVRAGLVAAGIVALHYAADVPVRWASGSQDLLAIAGALGALWLHLAGYRLWAAPVLVLALLSKEVVALTPLIAVVAAREQGETWRSAARRAWPLAAAVAAWVLIAWAVSHGRIGTGAASGVTPAAALATVLHLVQVALAIEWGTASEVRAVQLIPEILPLALALLGVAAVAHAATPEPAGRMRATAGRGIRTGLAWALAASAPAVVVASVWSAYYYLFALCGVALALGAWLGARGRVGGLIAVGLIAWVSAFTSSLPLLAMISDPWTTCSHVNRHYMERGTGTIARYLRQLRAARPTLPPRGTAFFSGIPGAVAFQTADGPLVRWAYRDTSLRSYYLNDFDRGKAQRGPMFFFEARGDSLVDATADPNLFIRISLAAILSDRPESAREMLAVERVRKPSSSTIPYWMSWVEWDLGERERARQSLSASGFQARPGPTPEIEAAIAAVQAGDTLRAVGIIQRGVQSHPLDPRAHGLLSDLAFEMNGSPRVSVIEAYAARVLDPTWPPSWRRWAMIQAQHQRFLRSAHSLRRYFELAGSRAEGDSEAQALANYLRTEYPAAGRALDAGRTKR